MKRQFDVVMALCGLMLFAPIMLVVASWIRITSPGPVLFSQIRIVRYGRPFRLYKFRSMVIDADRYGSSVTTGRDPRITTVGRILRKTKLDELPQLWNVLRGDMSFVGPRPDVAEIIETYTPQMRHILDVRPGITSIASLHLRHEEDLLSLAIDPDTFYVTTVVPAKVELAMEHVRRNSFLFDLTILLQTVWAVVAGRSAQIAEHPVIANLRQHALQHTGAAISSD